MSYNTLFHYCIVFYSGINNTNGGNQIDEFKNPYSMNYIAFGLSTYNIDFNHSTSLHCNDIEHYEDECVNNKECTQFLQNSLVPPCTMQNNSRPEITISEPKKHQPFYALSSSILGQASMVLCDWLRNVQSGSSTGGACSSSALEILKRREKIRYVFQHNPSYFIDVSYILSSLLC